MFYRGAWRNAHQGVMRTPRTNTPALLEALELYVIAIISRFSSGEVYKTRESVITIEIYSEF